MASHIVAYALTSSSDEDSSADEQEICPSSAKRSRPPASDSPQRSSGDDDGEWPGEVDAHNGSAAASQAARVASGEEEQEHEKEVEEQDQRTVSSSSGVSSEDRSGKKPYALQQTELPAPMREFLKEVADFFTRAVNLERQKQPISRTTYRKTEERIKCFLGFLRNNLRVELRPEVFLRVSLIEQYLDFLREERQCSPATIGNHCSSLLYPVKFLHREQAPDYLNVPVITQLRKQANIFQKEGELERPRTKEELRALNRWLEWDEIVAACGRQRDYFAIAVNKREKARECCNLVILALYVFIPPGRGLEVRTLEINHNWQEFAPRDFKGQNILLVKNREEVALHFDSYKTVKYSGHQEVTLKGDHELCRIILDYISNHRGELLTANSGDTLLLNRNGERFSCASFSAHVKSLFLKLTGTAITINSLRSAFVTWTYGKQNITDSLKSSLAAALRHSRGQAERTYDRRTANQRKEEAVSLAREYAEGSLCDGPAEGQTVSERPASGHARVKPGQFVGLAEEDSTLKRPKVLIAQVHTLLPNGKASLLWYKPHKNFFRLELDGDGWVEDVDCLVPVTMQPANNKPGWFRLGGTLREIHRSIHGDD